ncbi:molybdenum cofactor biosynthesis protein MoaE [Streptomyces lusitanus]|uniref:molybdenum cofactor biosynthesis protein MoaE n=1 Tax=Streptomyces lusitanus TaxID=68232 RepID=UPI00362EB9C6
MSENHDPIRLLAIRETPLSLDEVYEAVGDDAAGGTTVFVGTVRDHDGGKSVAALEYSCHPTAEQEIAPDRREGRRGLPRPGARRGAPDRPAGDHRQAVIVAVSCAHRGEAFAAARRLIDDLKHEVPIWKHQVFSDGEEEWVGAGSC